MIERPTERLYNLLPVIYRQRDTERGEPLRALMNVIETEFHNLESDIAHLYDNWFIESCDKWVIPYIADLIGIRGLNTLVIPSQRTQVADTLAYRRRKGTIHALEQVAANVTGWGVRAVECFEQLATTQHLDNIRRGAGGSVDMRDMERLAWAGTPFDTFYRTADVRQVSSTYERLRDENRWERIPGKFNIPNVVLSVWRLQSYPLFRVMPFHLGDGRYTFDPLGIDAPLFNVPPTPRTGTIIPPAATVPDVLRRKPLADELEDRRQALVEGAPHRPLYFELPVFEIYLDGSSIPIPPEQIAICDLSDEHAKEYGGEWPRPENVRTHTEARGGTNRDFEIKVGVDPETGRFLLLDGEAEKVEVSYARGFSADIGGGPYNRRRTFAVPTEIMWRGYVSKSYEGNESSTIEGGRFATLGAALDAWGITGKDGIVKIMDSATYELEERLLVHAARKTSTEWATDSYTIAIEASERTRPTIRGDIVVIDRKGGTRITLNGILLDGSLRLGGNVQARIYHCTLRPLAGRKSIVGIEGDNSGLAVTIDSSIVGPIHLSYRVAGIAAQDSIIDGAGGYAIVGAVNGEKKISGPITMLERVTVLGKVYIRSLTANDSIFADDIQTMSQHSGSTRYCYVPEGSSVPRPYCCQPHLALSYQAAKLGYATLEQLSDDERAFIAAMVRPAFTSRVFGQPGYAQLDDRSAAEIDTGAEDGSEMGAFNMLRQHYRRSNLRIAIDNYLRVGLSAGIEYIT